MQVHFHFRRTSSQPICVSNSCYLCSLDL